jgi:regulation of enolase protein 1 (concanavalin A-like superfamily)
VSLGVGNLAGLAVTSHDNTRTANATFDNVAVTSASSTLPVGWKTADVGSVGIAGSAAESNGTFTLTGSGPDIWGTADAFRYAYTPLIGDGVIVARVGTVQNVHEWTKAGVMIRQTLDAGSAHASVFVTPGKGLAFQRRPTAGATSLNTSVGGAAPQWVKLARAGQTVSASMSPDGSTWTLVGQDTVALNGAVWIGLALTSHDDTRAATATFDNVRVISGVPPGWQDIDVGSTSVAGSASYANGVFTVNGSGADIWGTADAFHFVYRSLSGNGQIVARVASVQNTHRWAKAGVMIRQTLGAEAPEAMMLVSAAEGTAFQYRTSSGGSSINVTGTPTAVSPTWVGLVRSGDTIAGYQSSDGHSWQLVGTVTIAIGSSVQIGLAVTSHDDTALCQAFFDNVSF